MRGISKKSILIRIALIILGTCVWADGANATPIIAAYQEMYRMNFEVLHQEGLPPGWYVTFDGYPVAQVAPNHWVYARAPHPGVLVPTEVPVGSVVPINAPQLARVAVSPWNHGIYDTQQFRSIALAKLDNMGILDDPLAYTPVAWKTNEPGLRIWLGDRWYRVVPLPGQSNSQALMAQHPYIVRTLNKKGAVWTMADTRVLADLAREWGYLWQGHIPFASIYGYRESASGEGSVGAGRGGGSIGGGAPSGGGEWDTGGGGTTGSGGGGGWDAGGGGSGGGTTGGGGGWDSGGGGGSGDTSSGGGWDK